MENKNITSVVVVGHVDHGKSTFIGRLLLDTDQVSPDRLKDIQKTSAELGRKVEYAYLMDQFQEEREANITIDTTQVLLKVEGRSILIIDAPGHKEYLKNMITGATQARQAILMLDVNEGVREQTEKHAKILKLLGIHHVAVLINKMDTVAYSENVFNGHKSVIEEMFKTCGLEVPLVIPISAYNGENVSTRSPQMKWYDGPIALDFLKKCAMSDPVNKKGGLRFPVQLIHSVEGEQLALGRIEKGSLTLGQSIRVFPSGEILSIQKINKFNENGIRKADAGECVGIQLSKKMNLKRGDVLCESAERPASTTKFSADVFWAAEQPLVPGDELLVECRTQSGRAAVLTMQEQLDDTPLQKLAAGDVGRVIFTSSDPLWLEPMNEESPLARIVFQKKGQVVGCGVVSQILALFLVIIFWGVRSSHAYVDPGTGVTFVSGLGALLWGLITLGFGAIVLTFKKWKEALKALFRSKK